MNFTKKNLILVSALSMIASTSLLMCSDYITITDPIPSGSGSVSGNPLIMDGTSSEPNMNVRLFINGTEVSPVGTDGSGNWSQNVTGLGNGSYTLTAWLTDSSFNILATDSVSFTVDNGNSIYINSPYEGQTVSFDPVTLSGAASIPSATINILLDSNQVASTTADGNGNWETSYTVTAANGVHTFTVELMAGDDVTVLASANVDVIANIPLVFPSGTSQLRFINGDIPTTGSGSGDGYTYTISGSTLTINFVPAFSITPSITATGLKSSGSSTVSLTSVTTTAASIAFSSGTQKVHFSASALQ